MACLAFALALGLFAATGQSAGPNWGFDINSLDKTCEPCKDFYQFANGGWIQKNPVPAAFPSWGRFNELNEKNRDTLRQILEESASNPKAAKGSSEQKIGDYYASCMDEARIEKDGLKPLEPALIRINNIEDVRGLQDEIARLQGDGVNVLFDFHSTEDARDAARMIAEASQAGMGLPDKDYYFKDDARMKNVRDEYVKHIARMFELMGDDAARARTAAQVAMSIETKLAEGAMTAVEQRDPNALYNKMSLAQLKSLTPNFSWDAYLKQVGAGMANEINITQPKFFKGLDQMLTAVPLSDWKTYLRWRLISFAAPALPARFVEENFNFNGKVLTGSKELLPRWKRCVSLTNGVLGEAVGQVYVKKNFSPEAKRRVLEMVSNLKAVLRSHLATMEWMGADTRKAANAKLDTFLDRIGYPDKWRDYSALEVDRGPFALNRMRAIRFDFNRQIGKIGKARDRNEWPFSPAIVNAFYNSTNNTITFPAGILQPPFFDPQADDAINYGGIGSVIGHEIIHGFDDEGSQFDADGNLKNWWTADDRKNFEARASCVEKQFNGFQVEENLYTNGKLVLGESIADLGGLTIAYAAYQKSLAGKERQVLDGFTPEQRFFLGYAQVWGGNVRPEFARLLTQADPHPLPRFRVNGPLSNMPQFAQAFECKASDQMVRPDGDRCKIW
jgi:putative endopeptidase